MSLSQPLLCIVNTLKQVVKLSIFHFWVTAIVALEPAFVPFALKKATLRCTEILSSPFLPTSGHSHMCVENEGEHLWHFSTVRLWSSLPLLSQTQGQHSLCCNLSQASILLVCIVFYHFFEGLQPLTFPMEVYKSCMYSIRTIIITLVAL